MSNAPKYKDQRVAILIDTQNLYHSAKNLYNAKVNFGEIVKYMVAGRSLVRAIAYVVKSDEPQEAGFFEALNQLGIELRIKPLQVYAGGFKKGDWDVGMAVDAIRFSRLVDTLILVTGDGDFIPLVEYLKNQGSQAEVAAFEKTSSQKLKEVADNFIPLDAERFLIKAAIKKRPYLPFKR